MMRVKRTMQAVVLATLALLVFQPQLLAFDCDDFMELAWNEAQDDCGSAGILSQECECSEENGEVTNGVCFTICELE